MKLYESFTSLVRFLISSEFVIQTTERFSTDGPIFPLIKHGFVMFSGDYKIASLAWNEWNANIAIKIICIWETTSQLTFPYLKLIKTLEKGVKYVQSKQ